MQGYYLGIIPRNSIFFYPERHIRRVLLEQHGNLAGISFFRNGTRGVTLRVIERVPIARWCPDVTPKTASTTESLDLSECWFFDDSGLLFATSSQVAVVNPFIIYQSLGSALQIRGQTLPNAERVPASLNLARQLDSFGATAVSITLEAPEATIALKSSGARIVYLLGKENEAYTALVSGKNQVSLTDSALDYVDLRFSGKMYVKRKGDSVAE